MSDLRVRQAAVRRFAAGLVDDGEGRNRVGADQLARDEQPAVVPDPLCVEHPFDGAPPERPAVIDGDG